MDITAELAETTEKQVAFDVYTKYRGIIRLKRHAEEQTNLLFEY
jgi:hypothetical protein